MTERFASERPLTQIESLRLAGRALGLARPDAWRFGVKLGFSLLSLVPTLVLAWPLKILVDTVILGIPIEENPTPFPFFIQPLVELLTGASPFDVVLWISGLSFGLIFLVGGFGFTAATRDEVGDWGNRLAEGQDTATRTENQASYATSKMGGLLGLLEYRWTLRLSHRLNHRLRSALFGHIQRLPVGTLEDERIGDAVYRVMYDTPTITKLCYDLIITPVRAPLQIGAVAWLLHSSYAAAPGLAQVGLLALPVSMVLSFLFLSAIRQRSEQSRASGAATTATMEEGMTNILAVQSLGGMEVQKRRFETRSSDSYADYLSLFAMQLGAHGVAVLAIVAAVAYLFFTVTDLTIAGIFTAGDLTVLYILYAQIFGAGMQLALLWMKQQDNLAGLRRVFFVLDLPAEKDPPEAVELPRIREGVRFESVSFRYEDGTEALKGVDIEAGLGEIVALVGATGAGKTTLASMIPRFRSPSTGAVRIDGMDLEGVRLESLRSQIAFVFQETVLFDASVEENIRVANPGATDADVRRAARGAGADEFIARLPQGYRTRIGVAGGRLSVGQKQRLSIARALVRDAPILILDEPTSALDPETEQQLVKSLRDASRSRLVLVVAHRLSTIRAADQILFLQDGRVLERGTHAELMNRPAGAYRAFTMLQTRSVA